MRPLCFAAAGVGADDQLAPVADPAVAGPDFLAVDDVVIAVELGFGLQSGEIGAGVGLGKTLAPDFFRAENFGNEALFLGFCSASDDGGTDQPKAERVGHRRSFGASHFFPEKRLLHEGGAATTVLFGPRDGGPAAFVKLALPGAKVRKRFLKRLFTPFCPVFGGVGGEPRA